jgi:hypothetical protein
METDEELKLRLEQSEVKRAKTCVDSSIPDAAMETSTTAASSGDVAGSAVSRGVVRAREDDVTVDLPESQRARVGEAAVQSDSGMVASICQVMAELSVVDVSKSDVSELYNPNRFGEQCSAFNLVAGTAFDLRIGWDLSTVGGSKGRNACWARLEAEQPEFVVGSPPCGPFSQLWSLTGEWSEEMKRRHVEALEHIRFCFSVYKWQHLRGKYFLHEHPLGCPLMETEVCRGIVSNRGRLRGAQ